METTTLDYAILGLLLETPRTAYAIRKAFEETALGNFSSSPGTIYPATKRLKKMGLISHPRGESPSILMATPLGKSKMREWLVLPISQQEVAKNPSHLLLKFAFMEHLISRSKQAHFLQSMIAQTQEYIISLESYHKNHSKELPLTGKLAFEYGIAQCKTQLTWAKSALKEIKQNK